MRSLVIVSLLALATAARAQPAGSNGSAAPTNAPAQPAGSSTAPTPAAGSAAPTNMPAQPPAAPAAATDARKACTTAMNADPTFAVEIVKVASDKSKPIANNSFVDELCRDADTIKAHEDAVYHVEKNEKHVIYAYAAMWLVAAAFVLFLWRRQQALKLEISHLRRDLEAAASDTGTKESKS